MSSFHKGAMALLQDAVITRRLSKLSRMTHPKED
jgi:hypothetical protein